MREWLLRKTKMRLSLFYYSRFGGAAACVAMATTSDDKSTSQYDRWAVKKTSRRKERPANFARRRNLGMYNRWFRLKVPVTALLGSWLYAILREDDSCHLLTVHDWQNAESGSIKEVKLVHFGNFA